MKVGYSCMINVQILIKKHNNIIQNKKNKKKLSFKCHDKNVCPLNGNCRTQNIIYRCTSPTKNNVKNVYLSDSEWGFKKNWFYNHQQLMWNKNYTKSTTLTTYLWGIKSTSEQQNVNLSWEIIGQADPHTNTSKQCLLCLHKTLAIVLYPNPEELLNKRSQMISKCRHLNKLLLMNFNSNN